MMEPFGQQNRDDLLIETLRYTIEANTHAMEEYKKASANMCIKVKESMNNHHLSMNHFLITLDQVSASDNDDEKQHQALLKVKENSDKLFFTVSEFYEKEYMRCLGSNSFEENSHYQGEPMEIDGDETNDCKEQIELCSVQDTLDKLIAQAESRITLERQKSQQQQ